MGKKKKAIVTTVIRYLIILIFCVPMIMPLLWMLTTALKDNVMRQYLRCRLSGFQKYSTGKTSQSAYSRLNSGNVLATLYLFP